VDSLWASGGGVFKSGAEGGLCFFRRDLSETYRKHPPQDPESSGNCALQKGQRSEVSSLTGEMVSLKGELSLEL
jgi:hypothetical protein